MLKQGMLARLSSRDHIKELVQIKRISGQRVNVLILDPKSKSFGKRKFVNLKEAELVELPATEKSPGMFDLQKWDPRPLWVYLNDELSVLLAQEHILAYSHSGLSLAKRTILTSYTNMVANIKRNPPPPGAVAKVLEYRLILLQSIIVPQIAKKKSRGAQQRALRKEHREAAKKKTSGWGGVDMGRASPSNLAFTYSSAEPGIYASEESIVIGSSQTLSFSNNITTEVFSHALGGTTITLDGPPIVENECTVGYYNDDQGNRYVLADKSGYIKFAKIADDATAPKPPDWPETYVRRLKIMEEVHALQGRTSPWCGSRYKAWRASMPDDVLNPDDCSDEECVECPENRYRLWWNGP